MIVELALLGLAVSAALKPATASKGPAKVLKARQLALAWSVQKFGHAAGLPVPLLLAIGDHESGLNPDNGIAGLDPTGVHERNAGAFGHTVATLKGLGANIDRIVAGDIDEQAKAAVALWRDLARKYGNNADRIIGAWWVGAGGLDRIERGETLKNYYYKKGISPVMVANFVRNIRARAKQFEAWS